MKKNLVMLTAVLSFGLLLAGCFRSPSDQVSEKIGGEIAEKAFEAQLGENVDIDVDNGTMNIADENINMQVSTGGEVSLPENFSKDLVIPSDAKVIVATAMDKTTSVAYHTDADKKELSEDYISLLTGQGWAKKLDMDLDTSIMINFEKDNTTLSCVVSDNNNKDEGKTIVSITLTEK